MSDFRTALINALDEMNNTKEKQMNTNIANNTNLHALVNAWDAEEPPKQAQIAQPKGVHRFQTTTNVSRATFFYVRDNPNKLYGEIRAALVAQGFNMSSIGTLLAQMVRNELIKKQSDGSFIALKEDYTPIKNHKTMCRIEAAREAKTKRKYVKTGAHSKKAKEAGIAALKVQTSNTPVPVAKEPAIFVEMPSHKAFDPDALLSTLSFNDTMTLYRKLRTMLGEL